MDVEPARWLDFARLRMTVRDLGILKTHHSTTPLGADLPITTPRPAGTSLRQGYGRQAPLHRVDFGCDTFVVKQSVVP